MHIFYVVLDRTALNYGLAMLFAVLFLQCICLDNVPQNFKASIIESSDNPTCTCLSRLAYDCCIVEVLQVLLLLGILNTCQHVRFDNITSLEKNNQTLYLLLNIDLTTTST